MQNTYMIARKSSCFYALFITPVLFLLGTCCLHAQMTGNVVCSDTFYVKFPDDRIITACDGIGHWGEPVFFPDTLNALAASFKDDSSYTDIYSCLLIRRTWRVIDWCTYNATCPLTPVPNPNPMVSPISSANLRGPIVSGIQQPGNPWAATVMRVSATDPGPTNFYKFWKAPLSCGGLPKFNGYTYEQVIRVQDTEQPQVQAAPIQGGDSTANIASLWDDPAFWNASLKTSDLPEAPTSLSITAFDLCSGSRLKIRYQLFLDLDGNEVPETLIDSDWLPSVGQVMFGNLTGNGKAVNFDKRTGTWVEKYQFALQTVVNGQNKVTASVKFSPRNNPSAYWPLELPYGKHKIVWSVTDPCDNVSTVEQVFSIQDVRPPSLKCRPLTVNIGSAKNAAIAATDLLEDLYDNITPNKDLKTALSTGEPAPAAFPRDAAGNPIGSLTFECENLGPNVVQVWAEDQTGNAGFCQVLVLIQDNLWRCRQKPSLKITTHTETGQGIAKVDFSLSPFHPAALPLSLYMNSPSAGVYVFSNAIPWPISYKIKPIRNDNPLNGVNVSDVSVLARHLTGAQKLNSPYKIIAADVNKSGAVNSADLVVLRRVILGLDPAFPNNTSWRFVNRLHMFPNPQNPFSPAFPEDVSILDAQEDSLKSRFIGIKIGDLNGTVQPNNLTTGASGDRSRAIIQVQDRSVVSGERIAVVFESQEPLAAQQFTLEHPGLKLLAIEPLCADMSRTDFGFFPESEMLTHAWSSTAKNGTKTRFQAHFRATQAGQLSDFLRLSDQITPALAYATGEVPQKPDLVFLPPAAALQGLTVLQQAPNPFSEKTDIQFYLPKSSLVSLRITDANGRLLAEAHRTIEAGVQHWPVDGNHLPAGVLFCTLTSENSRAMIKMIRL